MNSFTWNGREYAFDQLSPQQRVLMEAVIESENRLRTTERAAFLDRMAHEGARNMFIASLMADENQQEETNV